MIAWDIETGGFAEEILELSYPNDYKPPSNWKDPEKIEEARLKHKGKYFDKAALDPTTSECLAIGLNDGARKWRIGDGNLDGEESEIITGFWEFAEGSQEIFACHNSSGFDLPYLVRRSWLLGIEVPAWVRKGRYWSDKFTDTHEIWQCGQRNEFIELERVAHALGMPGKKLGPDGKPLSGAEFGRLWRNPETKPLAIEYLDDDLRMTYDVAERIVA